MSIDAAGYQFSSVKSSVNAREQIPIDGLNKSVDIIAAESSITKEEPSDYKANSIDEVSPYMPKSVFGTRNESEPNNLYQAIGQKMVIDSFRSNSNATSGQGKSP